jgi:Transposase
VENTITWVGLDAHKATIQVAMLLPGRAEPVQWQVANEPRDVRRLVRKIQRAAPGAIRSCYEAGVCGYALQRQLEVAGMACEVIAPALVPVKRGDRIKTDKRDARKLATLLRAGLLTAVRPPTPAEEAARDLCRAREDAVGPPPLGQVPAPARAGVAGVHCVVPGTPPVAPRLGVRARGRPHRGERLPVAPGEAWRGGKRCVDNKTRKPSERPGGSPIPPGKGWPPAGTECCVVIG